MSFSFILRSRERGQFRREIRAIVRINDDEVAEENASLALRARDSYSFTSSLHET